jgi:hypothetical protein
MAGIDALPRLTHNRIGRHPGEDLEFLNRVLRAISMCDQEINTILVWGKRC